MQTYHVSQAVFKPDENVITVNTLEIPRRPSLYHWTKPQYEEKGPFDNWLKKLNVCRTREKCCVSAEYTPSNFANIIIRDFPTKTFISTVIAKNYKSPQSAKGSEGECEEEEYKKELEREEEARRKKLEREEEFSRIQ